MTQRFDDMAAERDAKYQALRGTGEFQLATALDRFAMQCEKNGKDVTTLQRRAFRDSVLLRLAIRALTARR